MCVYQVSPSLNMYLHVTLTLETSVCNSVRVCVPVGIVSARQSVRVCVHVAVCVCVCGRVHACWAVCEPSSAGTGGSSIVGGAAAETGCGRCWRPGAAGGTGALTGTGQIPAPLDTKTRTHQHVFNFRDQRADTYKSKTIHPCLRTLIQTGIRQRGWARALTFIKGIGVAPLLHLSSLVSLQIVLQRRSRRTEQLETYHQRLPWCLTSQKPRLLEQGNLNSLPLLCLKGR